MELRNQLIATDLPDEILLKIFAHVPVTDIVQNVALVCRRWHSLVCDASLFMSIHVTKRMTHRLAVQLLRMAKRLKQLVLESRNDATDLLNIAACSCPHITELTVRNSRVDLTSWQLQELNSLTLIGCQVNNFSGLADFAPLVNLAVHWCRSSSGAKLQDELFRSVVLSHRVTLQSVQFDDAGLTDATFIALGMCPFLRILLLNCAYGMTDIGLEGLAKLQNLSKLRIHLNNELTSASFVAFFTSPYITRSICHVDISYCNNVDDAVLEALSNCPNLTHIYCTSTDVTEVGISYILQACQNLDLVNANSIKPESNITTRIP